MRLPFCTVLVSLLSSVPGSTLGDGSDEIWQIEMVADGTKGALGREPHILVPIPRKYDPPIAQIRKLDEDPALRVP